MLNPFGGDEHVCGYYTRLPWTDDREHLCGGIPDARVAHIARNDGSLSPVWSTQYARL